MGLKGAGMFVSMNKVVPLRIPRSLKAPAPNPSIERTSPKRLHHVGATAHVKR